VVSLVRARIERALARRDRYRYVQPRVEPEGAGWKIVSPNCSRTVDAQGGDIDIAWFQPDDRGRWHLHARDHHARDWCLHAEGLTLESALETVCADLLHAFWP
jgi:hypothetical protein